MKSGYDGQKVEREEGTVIITDGVSTTEVSEEQVENDPALRVQVEDAEAEAKESKGKK